MLQTDALFGKKSRDSQPGTLEVRLGGDKAKTKHKIPYTGKEKIGDIKKLVCAATKTQQCDSFKLFCDRVKLNDKASFKPRMGSEYVLRDYSFKPYMISDITCPTAKNGKGSEKQKKAQVYCFGHDKAKDCIVKHCAAVCTYSTPCALNDKHDKVGKNILTAVEWNEGPFVVTHTTTMTSQLINAAKSLVKKGKVALKGKKETIVAAAKEVGIKIFKDKETIKKACLLLKVAPSYCEDVTELVQTPTAFLAKKAGVLEHYNFIQDLKAKDVAEDGQEDESDVDPEEEEEVCVKTLTNEFSGKPGADFTDEDLEFVAKELGGGFDTPLTFIKNNMALAVVCLVAFLIILCSIPCCVFCCCRVCKKYKQLSKVAPIVKHEPVEV